MNQHRGLTLLEVLAATVLLAMIAAACVPMLTGAATNLDAAQLEQPSSDLVRLSEMFCDDPASFGVTDLQSMRERTDFEIEWPKQLRADEQPQSVVSVHCLHAKSSESDVAIDHVWLIFEHDGHKIMGWFPLPKPPTIGEAKP